MPITATICFELDARYLMSLSGMSYWALDRSRKDYDAVMPDCWLRWLDYLQEFRDVHALRWLHWLQSFHC